MELYKKLAGLGCFTHKDMVKLTGSESSAAWQIRNYLKKGYIERVRRNLYAVISLETLQPIPNRYQIASHVTDDACVSHHSAFEYHGLANQVFYEVYFATKKRIRPFIYDGISYYPIIYRGDTGIMETKTGVRITSIERTVIDDIADFDRNAGLEELLRCLLLIPTLNPDKLLDALALYNRSQLYQKTGYILETLNDEFYLPEYFFEECEKRSSASKTYLFKKRSDFILHNRWKLYAPEDLRTIVNKGVDYDALL